MSYSPSIGQLSQYGLVGEWVFDAIAAALIWWLFSGLPLSATGVNKSLLFGAALATLVLLRQRRKRRLAKP
jgi:hypothetical protein